MSAKLREFRAHPNLIRLVIERQAGTVAKSALEGAMNSIDAGCTLVEVEVKPTHMIIRDNGKGFTSEEEITNWFEEFGNPHELDKDGYSQDAKYGTFRSGRGQLFAFGKNTWKTNEFQMYVDIKAKGLGYKLTKLKTPLNGCEIKVEFYEPLKEWQLQGTIDEVKRFCKYSDTTVTVNGTQINHPIANEQWDVDTDLFCVKFATGTPKGIDIYQQGVYVENIGSYVYGVSGTLVVKEQVKLNFARNQVIRSCPRWKKVIDELSKHCIIRLKNKTTYDSSERSAIATEILAMGANSQYKEAKILRDVTGRYWSIDQLRDIKYRRLKGNTVDPDISGNVVVSVDSANSIRGDKVMQERKAVVFDRSVLALFNITSGQALQDLLNKISTWSHIVYKRVEDLADKTVGAHRVLTTKETTAAEKLVLEIIAGKMWRIPSTGHRTTRYNSRLVHIGLSDNFNGWTDGSTYIVINRAFLKSCDLDSEAGWAKLCLLLIHELCHDSSSEKDTHIHSPEFYRGYHDSTFQMTRTVTEMFTSYVIKRKNEFNRLTKKMQKNLDKIAANKKLYKQIADTESTLAMHNADGSLKKPRKRKKAVLV